jgi:hypothetical protein
MKFTLLCLLFFLFLHSCKNSFNYTSDYRQFPIAVDCEKASDVSLTFKKEGLPTIHIDETKVEFKVLVDDKGVKRPVCIFDDMSLLDFCKYKDGDTVAPYWESSYQKINAVKCKEVIK